MKAFFNFFSLRSHSVRQASALLAITALLSNVLGLLRNLIYYRLIPFDQLDVFLASFRIPDLIFNVLIVAAITSAVIPILSEHLAHKEEEEAWAITNQLLTWGTIIFLLLIVVLWVGMDPLMHQVVKHFQPGQLAESIRVSRLLLVQSLFFAWSYILGALLNGYRRFTTYAFAPLIYNLSLIIGGVAAHTYGIFALTYAVIIGSFLHFLIQYSEIRRMKIRLKIDTRFTPTVRHILSIMLPRSLTQGMINIVLLVYTTLASGLPTSSISIFFGINDIQTTPTVIVANSLATAFFPSLAILIAKEKWAEMSLLLEKAFRSALFLLLPTIGMSLILRAQIVRLYIGIGHATWNQTDLAIITFAWFMIGVLPSALVILQARIFYAYKDTYTPALIAVGAGLLGILISFIGVDYYHQSVSIFAFSETIIATTQAIAFYYVLKKRGHVNMQTSIVTSASLRYLTGTVLAVIATWCGLHFIDWLYSLAGLSTLRVGGLLVQTAFAATIGILVYFGYSTRSNKEELQWVQLKSFLKKA